MKKYILILLILILPTISSLIRPGFFPMQDDLQAFRLSELEACIKEGQIPCRWTPLSGYGYGYPLFQYYAPGPFYIGYLFRLINIQFIDIVKILFVVGTFVGGISMYVLIHKLGNKKIALLSTVIYIYLPYHAQQMYVRGSLNEFIAGMLYPLITYLAIIHFEKKTNKSLAFFSLSLGLLFITHNLMSYFLIPILFIFSIIYKSLRRFLTGLILSLVVSSFFIVPLYLEREYVHLESLLGGYFGYEQHFVSLKQLLIDNRWGYGSSQLGTTEDLNLSVGLSLVVITFITFLFTVIKLKNIFLSILLGSYGIFLLFLIHEKSSFIWKILTPLEWLQFPWRLLLVVGFIFSLLIFSLSKNSPVKFQKYLTIIFITFSLLIHGSFFNPIKWNSEISDQVKFSLPNLVLEQTRSIFDYLPIYAKLPPNKPASEYPEILEGEGSVVSWNKIASKQYGQISISTESIIRLPIYDFPGMQVRVNDNLISHVNNDCRYQEYCFGQVSFGLPAGNHQVTVELTKTLPRIIGDILSVTGLLIIIILLCVS